MNFIRKWIIKKDIKKLNAVPIFSVTNDKFTVVGWVRKFPDDLEGNVIEQLKDFNYMLLDSDKLIFSHYMMQKMFGDFEKISYKDRGFIREIAIYGGKQMGVFQKEYVKITQLGPKITEELAPFINRKHDKEFGVLWAHISVDRNKLIVTQVA